MEQPAYPPTEPEAFDDLMVDRPAWPKVIGIISIIWSSLGLTCGAFGLVMGLFAKSLMKMAESQMGGPPPAVMLPQPSVMLIGVVGWLLTIVLLIAGIGTVTRKPIGRTMHLVYAVGSLIITPISTVMSWKAQTAISEWAAQHPADPWAQNANPGVGQAMLIFFTALGVSYALFCLIWFGLVKRTPESMTGGVEEPAA